MVWLLLFSLSNNYWFLPAGLRLAVLWRLPRRAWPAMAGLEWAGIMALSLWRDDFDTPLALLASATLPWLVYAAVVAGMGTRRDTRMAPLGSQLPRLLACGALAALANSISLLGADLLKTGALASPAQVLFDYGLGDFIGVLVFAATVLAVDEAVRTRQSSWRELLAYGAVLLPPAIVLLVAMLPMQQPQAYALVLSLFPLFWIASRFGWRPAAVCLTLLAAAVHGMENLHLWRAAQLQLLFTASAMAALLLGCRAREFHPAKNNRPGSAVQGILRWSSEPACRSLRRSQVSVRRRLRQACRMPCPSLLRGRVTLCSYLIETSHSRCHEWEKRWAGEANPADFGARLASHRYVSTAT